MHLKPEKELCLDSNPGGGNVAAGLPTEEDALCLDSNPGGGNVDVMGEVTPAVLCLDSNPGGGNVSVLRKSWVCGFALIPIPAAAT